MEKSTFLHAFAFLYSISNEHLYIIMNQKRNQKLLRIFFLISRPISNGVGKNLWPSRRRSQLNSSVPKSRGGKICRLGPILVINNLNTQAYLMRNPMKSLFVPCVISKAILLISFNEHKLGHSNKQKELRGETLHLTNFK